MSVSDDDHLRDLVARAITGPERELTANDWRHYLESILTAAGIPANEAGAVIHPATSGPSRERLLEACDELELVVVELPILPVGALAIGRLATPEPTP